MSISLPTGVKDFLPETAGRLNRIGVRIARVFELWGYRGVITPYIEYVDALALAEPGLVDRMFKFEDRVSGKVLALRPDMTAQMARLAATHLKDHLKPLRLSYGGSVLHYGERDPGVQREIYQSGLELIGLAEPEADGEVIAIAIEALRSVGLSDFKIDVGQVEFFKGVMEMLPESGGLRNEVEGAVARKDRSRIEELLPELHLKKGEEDILLALPALFGDRTVLDRACAMTNNGRARAALDNLSDVMDTLDFYGLTDYVTIDLGEIRGLNYYTGVIFEGFVSGVGEEVCGGGRYDTLLGRYGSDLPATGFAINTEGLLRALERQGAAFEPTVIDCVVVNLTKDRRPALEIARHLRGLGMKVVRQIVKREMSETLGYAKSESIGRLIVIGADGLAADEFELHEMKNEKKSKHKIADLLEGRVGI